MLSLNEVILQSQIIHPDWTAAMHQEYLSWEPQGDDLPPRGRDYIARQLRDNIDAGRAPETPAGAQPKYDPDCDWAGHAEAMEEVGWCSVCQH